MVKVHGYTPAEVLMGFNPCKKQYNLENTQLVTYEDFQVDEPFRSHVAHLHVMLQNETHEWSMEAFAITNAAADAREQGVFPSWHRKWFSEGDLILVHDFQKEKNKGTPLDGSAGVGDTQPWGMYCHDLQVLFAEHLKGALG